MARSTSPKQYCTVRIGYTDLIMEATTGLKLMALLGQTLCCELQYDSERHQATYDLKERPKLAMEMVDADQIRPRQGRTGALALELKGR